MPLISLVYSFSMLCITLLNLKGNGLVGMYGCSYTILHEICFIQTSCWKMGGAICYYLHCKIWLCILHSLHLMPHFQYAETNVHVNMIYTPCSIKGTMYKNLIVDWNKLFPAKQLVISYPVILFVSKPWPFSNIAITLFPVILLLSAPIPRVHIFNNFVAFTQKCCISCRIPAFCFWGGWSHFLIPLYHYNNRKRISCRLGITWRDRPVKHCW